MNDFEWADPPTADPEDVYATRWFTDHARQMLDTRPGAWGRIARNAGNHVHIELRKRYPNYEFTAARETSGSGPRRYSIYARRRAANGLRAVAS
jgi:hypothetical protein